MATAPHNDDLPLDLLHLTDDLVTGDAVVLELRPASFATRALALALDAVIVIALLIVGRILFSTLLTTLDFAASAAVSTVWVIAVFVVLPVTVETLTRGRSLGKLAAGLRVVREDGGPIRFRHALVRALTGFVEIYVLFGFVPLIVSLISPRGQRFGDLLAGTYVIRERVAATVGPPVQMPPELAAWAVSADLGRIPDRLAAAVRALLARSYTLNPGSRQQLTLALADQLARHVAPPPPAGTLPERFLAAVLAERRRRDLWRLQAEQAARLSRQDRLQRASPLSATSSALIGHQD